METFLNWVRQLVASVGEFWTNLSLNRKVAYAAVALLLVCAGAFGFMAGTRTDYEPLYTQLSDKDAAAIVATLNENKTPYRLEDNGTTILVPTDVKYSTRLTLASENLPRGESGYELFRESTNFGETQTDKRVKYLEALQGELARTIQRIDKVKAAKVNVALPEPTLFSDQETTPKASVVINTQAGQTLTPQEVLAVTNLVANSVERLEPENVVIVDQYGTLLSDVLPQEGMAATSKLQMQLALKKEYEREKQTAIQTMLDRTLGTDNAVVRVNAELNFNDREEKTETYAHDPEGAFVRSEEIIKESSTTTPNTSGAPGTDSNIPQYTAATGGQGTSDSSSTSRNYEINKTETVTKYALGDVKYDYLTISVLVNNAATQNRQLGDTQDSKAATIRNIVATACGLRENRSNENVKLEDNISVAFIDFSPLPEPEPAADQGIGGLFKGPLVPWTLVGITMAIAVALALARRTRGGELVTPEGAVISGFDALADEEISLEALIDRSMTPEDKENQKIKEEIDKLIQTSPENAAQVIKAWLMED